MRSAARGMIRGAHVLSMTIMVLSCWIFWRLRGSRCGRVHAEWLLREGNQQVYAGSDGWLFLLPEPQHP